jgi:phospholipid transport system substrate-binding protein
VKLATRARAVGIMRLLALLPARPGAAAAEAAAQLGPQELMNDVSTRMFKALDANRAAIHKDADKVFPLVGEILLPHFDTEYAAQLILAQHWRTATPEQQKRFINAIYNALLHTYGNALGEFTADRLKTLPFRGDPGASMATVRTEVRRSSGALVPVDYRMHKTADSWKVFDVIIEGISYVRNFRADLGAEIDQKGLEVVVSRLEKEGLDTDLGGAGKPKPAAH